MSDQFAVGIDLGTTYFRVCVFSGDGFHIIGNEHKRPSCVANVGGNQWAVGEEAKSRAHEKTEYSLFSLRRMMASREIEDVTEEMKQLIELKYENGITEMKLQGEERTISPIHIMALILHEARKMAEEFLHKVVTKAVVTVPACFTDTQRKYTSLAAKIAGFEVPYIINDTMATYIYHAHELKLLDMMKNFVVVTVGGGSYDVSIFSPKDGAFEEHLLAGSAEHGGQDIDDELTEYYCQKVKATIEDGKRHQFLQECMKAKEQLSQCDATTFSAQNLDEDITFRMTTEHLKETKQTKMIISGIKEGIRMAMLNSENITIILVGGSAHMTCIQECIPIEKMIESSTNIEEVVVRGAAYHAYRQVENGGPGKLNKEDNKPSESVQVMVSGTLLAYCALYDTLQDACGIKSLLEPTTIKEQSDIAKENNSPGCMISLPCACIRSQTENVNEDDTAIQQNMGVGSNGTGKACFN